jgi:hypothetical protein
MERLKKFLWKLLKPKVDALITHRIILFHEGLVERGQVKRPPMPPNPVESHATE